MGASRRSGPSRRIVLFLGAGASVPYGYPTTEAILPQILGAINPKLRRASRPAWLRGVEKHNPRLRGELNDGLGLLLPGVAKAPLQGSASIIDILSTIDYLIASRQSLSPRFGEPELRTMRRQLDQCINGVLRGTNAPQMLKRVVSWVMREVGRGNRVSIITTNYDCTLDLPLYRELRKTRGHLFTKVDFGTSVLTPGSAEFNRPANAPVAMLKLHGSLNALRCEVCGNLYINPTQRIVSHDFRRRKDEFNSCTCDGRLRAILVAPSLVRDVREPHLLAIWNAALNELRLANEWNFIGYSLPQEDIAIRAMLLRALHGRTLKSLNVRLALWDTETQRARIRKRDRPAPPTDPEALLKERVARNTLRRYLDFLPARHFTATRSRYFPEGVGEFFS